MSDNIGMLARRYNDQQPRYGYTEFFENGKCLKAECNGGGRYVKLSPEHSWFPSEVDFSVLKNRQLQTLSVFVQDTWLIHALWLSLQDDFTTDNAVNGHLHLDLPYLVRNCTRIKDGFSDIAHALHKHPSTDSNLQLMKLELFFRDFMCEPAIFQSFGLQYEPGSSQILGHQRSCIPFFELGGMHVRLHNTWEWLKYIENSIIYLDPVDQIFPCDRPASPQELFAEQEREALFSNFLSDEIQPIVSRPSQYGEISCIEFRPGIEEPNYLICYLWNGTAVPAIDKELMRFVCWRIRTLWLASQARFQVVLEKSSVATTANMLKITSKPLSMWYRGHATLRNILKDRPPNDLVDILSAILVAYTMATFIYEKSGSDLREEFFADLYQWRNLVTQEHHSDFDNVIRDLWDIDLRHIKHKSAGEEDLAYFRDLLGQMMDQIEVRVLPGWHDNCYERLGRLQADLNASDAFSTTRKLPNAMVHNTKDQQNTTTLLAEDSRYREMQGHQETAHVNHQAVLTDIASLLCGAIFTIFLIFLLMLIDPNMVFNANLEATIASYFVSTILPSLLENATDPDLLRVIEHVATRIQSQEVEASGDIFAWILESVKSLCLPFDAFSAFYHCLECAMMEYYQWLRDRSFTRICRILSEFINSNDLNCTAESASRGEDHITMQTSRFTETTPNHSTFSNHSPSPSSMDTILTSTSSQQQLQSRPMSASTLNTSSEEGQTCSSCKKHFTNVGNLNRHVKTVHGDGNTLACDLCSKKVKSKDYLARHKRQFCPRRSRR